MAGKFGEYLGTLLSKFQLGLGGPQVKNESGDVAARNAADAAYAAIRTALVKTYGNDFELNSGAAGSGADWKFTLSRPSTGMTHALNVVFPAGDPTPGYVLSVVSLVGDVITLGWAASGGSASNVSADTTTIAFGDSSPVSMFTLPANAVAHLIEVIIDTAFNGTPSLSIGVSGTTSKYAGTTSFDLTAAAGTSFEVGPNLVADGTTNALIATYSAGGASAGSARVIVRYSVPA